jgi:hypothetical protein
MPFRTKYIVDQMMFKKVCLLVLQRQLIVRMIKTKIALRRDLVNQAKTQILNLQIRGKRERDKIRK